MSNVASYMGRAEGETRGDYLERILRDFAYARGGNHPEDVQRWIDENGVEWLVRQCWDAWSLYMDDPPVFEMATDDDIEDATAIVVETEEAARLVDQYRLDVEDDAATAIDDRAARRAQRIAERQAMRAMTRQQRRAAHKEGRQLLRLTNDTRPNTEKHGYAFEDLLRVANRIFKAKRR